jgi:hypothetical protein
MTIDQSKPGGASDDQTDLRVESLESTEMEDAELETISGGSVGPAICGRVNEIV